MKAYVLIQTEVGKAGQVADEIKKIGGVVSADNVTGVYDIIALVQSDSVDELGKKVVKEIQLVQGITRTLTCPIVNL
jgi:DNA-binding Lrp family transcriptional regulator